MCRMFAVQGSPEFATSLQKHLISSAKSDDFRESRGPHDSGWGGAWYSENDQRYYRSTIAIFKDLDAPKFFTGRIAPTDTLHGLSHARLAAKGEPIRGPFDSHPFSTHFCDELVYVTHNGHINKLKLKDEAGVKDVSATNDTEVFTFLMDRVEGSSARQRLEEAIKVVHDVGAMEGALNLMVLSINRLGGKKNIYYHCEFPESGKELYYSLYSLKEGSGNMAVMSSTLAYKAGFIDNEGEPLTQKISKCPKGRTLALAP